MVGVLLDGVLVVSIAVVGVLVNEILRLDYMWMDYLGTVLVSVLVPCGRRGWLESIV